MRIPNSGCNTIITLLSAWIISLICFTIMPVATSTERPDMLNVLAWVYELMKNTYHHHKQEAFLYEYHLQEVLLLPKKCITACCSTVAHSSSTYDILNQWHQMCYLHGIETNSRWCCILVLHTESSLVSFHML